MLRACCRIVMIQRVFDNLLIVTLQRIINIDPLQGSGEDYYNPL